MSRVTLLIATLVAALLLIGGAFIYFNRSEEVMISDVVTVPLPLPETSSPYPEVTTVGYSVEGRPIELYSFGTGSSSLLFVGGIHGGYEWNSVLLAYTMIDHLTSEKSLVPESLTLNIIPNLNPDGVVRIVGKEGRFLASDVPSGVDTAPGRFNANGVDLNRNFDCKWQKTSTWRGKTVPAGTAPFSEPEAIALRDTVVSLKPTGVVFWHSKANAVYASECENGILPGTRELMETYGTASNYQTIDVFDAYPVTGDAEGWLAKIGIPAITVELSTHETLEWERNLAGVTALLNRYSSYAR